MKLSYLITEEGINKISDEQNECEDLSDVALIMCTSGTTGKPKGAMITHSNLITNLTDISKYFGINDTDHILIARPLYHCAVLTGEFLISLIKGLRISFMTEGFVPTKILKKAKEAEVTVLCGTPTLLYHLSSINLKLKEPLVLKSIAVSGECMTEAVAKVMLSQKQIFTMFMDLLKLVREFHTFRLMNLTISLLPWVFRLVRLKQRLLMMSC